MSSKIMFSRVFVCNFKLWNYAKRPSRPNKKIKNRAILLQKKTDHRRQPGLRYILTKPMLRVESRWTNNFCCLCRKLLTINNLMQVIFFFCFRLRFCNLLVLTKELHQDRRKSNLIFLQRWSLRSGRQGSDIPGYSPWCSILKLFRPGISYWFFKLGVTF
jgi:hypothetical protein